MFTYTYENKTYNSIFELRNNTGIVFSDDVSKELLEETGIIVNEIPDPIIEITTNEEIIDINRSTTESIYSGFDYEINGINYHFSYESTDQQNFSDNANKCIIDPNTMIEQYCYTIPENKRVKLDLDSKTFIDLYVNGALDHKDSCLKFGNKEKQMVNDNV